MTTETILTISIIEAVLPCATKAARVAALRDIMGVEVATLHREWLPLFKTAKGLERLQTTSIDHHSISQVAEIRPPQDRL